MTKNTNLRLVSLFCGCGSGDLGFLNQGFIPVASFDFDKTAISTYNQNIGHNATLIDLTSEDSDLALSGIKTDVLLSTSPCQGFSTIGKRDIDDPRNSLLLRSGDICRRLKPRVFVAENVAGALYGRHVQYWDKLVEMLNKAGYETKTITINAKDFGLAQSRKRAFLIAWNTGMSFPKFSVEAKKKSILENLENVDLLTHHEKRYLDKTCDDYKIANYISQGQKLSDVRNGDSSVHTWDIPEVFGKTTTKERLFLESLIELRRKNRRRDWGDSDPVEDKFLLAKFGKGYERIKADLLDKGYIKIKEGGVDLKYTFNGKYRRFREDSITNTVDTTFGNPKYFLHPTEQRGFTVREAARLQGFPDWFQFSGKQTKDFKMIGNALPEPLAAYAGLIAKELAGDHV